MFTENYVSFELKKKQYFFAIICIVSLLRTFYYNIKRTTKPNKWGNKLCHFLFKLMLTAYY